MKRWSGVKPKELADLYRAAEAEGCEISVSGATHVTVRLPGGAVSHGPMTSSDHRTVLNLRSQLRAMGLSLPSGRQKGLRRQSVRSTLKP